MTNTPDNLSVLNFGNADEFQAALEQCKREMGNMIEAQKIYAQIRRASYEAYVEEGFTPAEALELCKDAMYMGQE